MSYLIPVKVLELTSHTACNVTWEIFNNVGFADNMLFFVVGSSDFFFTSLAVLAIGFCCIHSLVFSIEGRAWQEPEPSHVTGMALAHCILGKFLGVVCHCFPPLLYI